MNEDKFSPARIDSSGAPARRRTANSGLASVSIKSRLSVMPLAVLLPPLGELAELSAATVFFQERRDQIKKETATDSGDLSKKATTEEMMLSQVLQWLSVGPEET